MIDKGRYRNRKDRGGRKDRDMMTKAEIETGIDRDR